MSFRFGMSEHFRGAHCQCRIKNQIEARRSALDLERSRYKMSER